MSGHQNLIGSDIGHATGLYISLTESRTSRIRILKIRERRLALEIRGKGPQYGSVFSLETAPSFPTV